MYIFKIKNVALSLICSMAISENSLWSVDKLIDLDNLDKEESTKKRSFTKELDDESISKKIKKNSTFVAQETAASTLSVLNWSIQLALPTLDKGNSPAAKSGLVSLLFQPNSQKLDAYPFSFDGIEAPVNKALLTAGNLESVVSGYILYNDEDPSGPTNYSAGHTKGFLFWNAEYVWWTIHSVPKWPSSLTPLSQINDEHRKYGQSLIITQNPINNLEPIAHQLLVNTVNVYSSKIPESHKNGQWMSVLSKRSSVWSNFTQTISIQPFSYGPSATSIPMMHFAKNKEWDKDLCNDLIGPTLGIKTISETWEKPLMRITALSNNILEIKSNVIADYPETYDQPKWAISKDPRNPWVFILDINRMTSQFKRGGGGMGLNNLALWKAFSSLIAKTD